MFNNPLLEDAMSKKKSMHIKLIDKYFGKNDCFDKDNILLISDEDFYFLLNINYKNNNMSYCRHILDKRLKYQLSKSSNFELAERPENDKNLYEKCGKYIIHDVLNINYMIYGSNRQLGFMRDVDKNFDNEFVWTFVVPYEIYLIYIKIKFTKNTITTISFHENNPVYPYIFSSNNL